MSLKGIDISAYQGKVDFHAVNQAGYDFVYMKATEGVSFVDSHFADNWKLAKEAGLIRGAYHFFHPLEGAIIQAKHLCQTVSLQVGDLPLVVDVERIGPAPGVYAASLLACLQGIEKISGVRPIIYASPGWWNGNLSGDFSSYKLWVAHYTSAPHPNLPHHWQKWEFWQWSSSGQVPGVTGHVDLDRFQGDMPALQALCKK